MKKQYSAGIVLFFNEGGTRRYLLLRHNAGHWDFPKGKIEPGESKQDTALRELKEETGLDAAFFEGFDQNISYSFITPDGERVKKKVYFFVGEAFSKDIVLSSEHKDYAWLSYADALKRVTYKNNQQMLIYADAFLEQKIPIDTSVS